MLLFFSLLERSIQLHRMCRSPGYPPHTLRPLTREASPHAAQWCCSQTADDFIGHIRVAQDSLWTAWKMQPIVKMSGSSFFAVIITLDQGQMLDSTSIISIS